MDNKSANKFANEILDSFVVNRRYVNVTAMQNDIVSLLQKHGSKLVDDSYGGDPYDSDDGDEDYEDCFQLREKLYNIVMVNQTNFGGSSDSHFEDRLNGLLHNQFDERFKCPICSKTRVESDMRKCKKCEKMVCSGYRFRCAKNIKTGLEKPGWNFTHLCKVCLKSVY